MHTSPKAKDKKLKTKQLLWAEVDPNGLVAHIGTEEGLTLTARYNKGRIEIETIDAATDIEVQSYLNNLCIVFKKRFAKKHLPGVD